MPNMLMQDFLQALAAVLRIRTRMFLGLPDPVPSIIKQKL
jgi:hypothetical protein